ncbi:hypothetical protein V6N13_085738 [Hibiscus sabdariffa]|uniref:Uncharacterized protein n=1 Tax=Hibiscus sabdariffa TaxID=183260 RepID=A0ABR2FR17_9ROSI
MSAFTPNKIIHPATQAPQLFPWVPGTKHKMKIHRLISTIHPMAKTNKFSPGCITKVAGNNPGVIGEQDSNTLPHLKTNLLHRLKAFDDGNMESKAVNVIKFNARGLTLLNGKLTIEASFKIASKSRVDISYDNSTITPDQEELRSSARNLQSRGVAGDNVSFY